MDAFAPAELGLLSTAGNVSANNASYEGCNNTTPSGTSRLTEQISAQIVYRTERALLL